MASRPRMPFAVSRLPLAVGLLALAAMTAGPPGAPRASAQRLPLRTYSSADGLAGDHITALLADSRGFLWIGTNTGLSRFDGREFRHYGPAEGLPHPSVIALLEDRDGVLWIGSRGGLVRTEPNGTSMSPVRLPAAVAAGSTPPVVRRLLQTRDGRVWVAVGQELIVFPDERRREQAERVAINPVTPPPSPGSSSQDQAWEIEALAEGPLGDVWIGTRWGLTRRSRDGLMRHFRIRPTPADDRVFHLAVDAAGRVWLTHWGLSHRPGVHFGLYVFMPAADSAITSDPSRVTSDLNDRARRVTSGEILPLPRRPGEAIYVTAGGPLGDARVHRVLPLDDGTVWLATEAGLVRVGADGRAARFDDRNGLGLPIQRLARDAHGSLWLGTRGNGLVRFDVNGFVTFTAREGLMSGEVAEIVEDGDGALCISGVDVDGSHVFGVMDPPNAAAASGGERLTRFEPRGASHVKYWGWGWNQLFLRDRVGEWWVPTGEGLFRYPASTSCASIARTPPKAVYTRAHGLPNDDIFRLFEDSRGDFWISSGSEIVRWIRATGRFVSVPQPGAHPGNPPTGFAEGKNGDIWIGFYHGGVGRWRASASTDSSKEAPAGVLEMFGADDGVPDGFIQSIIADSRGRIWLGADPGGLARVDDPQAAHPRFTRFDGDQDLSDTIVSNIIEDRDANVYVATGRGLVRFDPAGTRSRRFTIVDGLASHQVRCALVTRDGRLWLGTHRGLSRLAPQLAAPPSTATQSVAPQAAAPAIFIDTLRVDGVPHSLSQLGATVVGPLEVDAGTRRLEIGYGSPSLAQGATPRYQVRLSGVDPDWGPASDTRNALYLNLSPGAYRFEARAVMRDGRVSARPAIVSFTIPPPIWQRLWFQAAIAFIVAGAGYLAYRSRVNHLLALERVRARIATDLHDDLGARLSRISILSEVAARRVSSDAASAAHLLDEVGDTARSLIETTADITWAVDPHQDDLASLAGRVRRFAADMLDARDIRWTFDAPDNGATIRLSPEHRRHVLLVFQEAINNVVRHARARRVSLGLGVDGHRLRARIEDDGSGFATNDASIAGRGLSNMASRARELGGELTVTSEAAAGTRVDLAVPLR
jgi:ligand-binding sensor domain-containing protein/signal transduction histidine kinase